MPALRRSARLRKLSAAPPPLQDASNTPAPKTPERKSGRSRNASTVKQPKKPKGGSKKDYGSQKRTRKRTSSAHNGSDTQLTQPEPVLAEAAEPAPLQAESHEERAASPRASHASAQPASPELDSDEGGDDTFPLEVQPHGHVEQDAPSADTDAAGNLSSTGSTNPSSQPGGTPPSSTATAPESQVSEAEKGTAKESGSEAPRDAPSEPGPGLGGVQAAAEEPGCLHIDEAAWDALKENVAPLLPDLGSQELEFMLLNLFKKLTAEGVTPNAENVAGTLFQLEPGSAEWQALQKKPEGVKVKEGSGSGAGIGDMRVMAVWLPRAWSWAACAHKRLTHTLHFDASSSKVVAEVDRTLRSIMSPDMDYLPTDRQAPYLLLNDRDEVVVLNKALLQACPTLQQAAGKERLASEATREVSLSQSSCVKVTGKAGKAGRVPTFRFISKGDMEPTRVLDAPTLETWHAACVGCNALALLLVSGVPLCLLPSLIFAYTVLVPASMVPLPNFQSAEAVATWAGVESEATQSAIYLLLSAATLYALVGQTQAIWLALRPYAARDVLRMFVVDWYFFCKEVVWEGVDAWRRWRSGQHHRLHPAAARAPCTWVCRPMRQQEDAPPAAVTVPAAWDGGLVWRRAHFTWFDKNKPKGAPGQEVFRMFSMVWLVDERADTRDATKAAVLKAAGASMDDAAFTQWCQAVRAGCGWQAPHLSLDLLTSSIHRKTQHNVLSRQFVASYPAWERRLGAGSCVEPGLVSAWTGVSSTGPLQSTWAAQHGLKAGWEQGWSAVSKALRHPSVLAGHAWGACKGVAGWVVAPSISPVQAALAHTWRGLAVLAGVDRAARAQAAIEGARLATHKAATTHDAFLWAGHEAALRGVPTASPRRAGIQTYTWWKHGRRLVWIWALCQAAFLALQLVPSAWAGLAPHLAWLPLRFVDMTELVLQVPLAKLAEGGPGVKSALTHAVGAALAVNCSVYLLRVLEAHVWCCQARPASRGRATSTLVGVFTQTVQLCIWYFSALWAVLRFVCMLHAPLLVLAVLGVLAAHSAEFRDFAGPVCASLAVSSAVSWILSPLSALQQSLSFVTAGVLFGAALWASVTLRWVSWELQAFLGACAAAFSTSSVLNMLVWLFPSMGLQHTSTVGALVWHTLRAGIGVDGWVTAIADGARGLPRNLSVALIPFTLALGVAYVPALLGFPVAAAPMTWLVPQTIINSILDHLQ